MRIGAANLSGHLYDGDRLGALNGRKIQQELIEGLPSFQIVKEIFHRDPSPGENGYTTLNRRISVDSLLFDPFPPETSSGFAGPS